MENKKNIISSPALSERVIAIYDIPIPDAVNILHCDQAVLRFGTYSVDVGSLCYLRRTNGKRRNKNGSYNPRLVDLSSFSEAREKQIKALISYASDLVTNGGDRKSTRLNSSHQKISY